MKPRSMDEILQDDVDTWLYDKNPGPLIEKFRAGIPLNEFECTAKLIVDLLMEKKPRSRGKKRAENDKDKMQRIHHALVYVAQGVGAGLSEFTSDSSNADPYNSAVNLVVRKLNPSLGLSAKQLKRHWDKFKDKPEAAFNREFGSKFSDEVIKYLRDI